jgi:hypothetical protein
MKVYILTLILLIPITSALQFSPTSLEFSLEKNQISCKEIQFQIESPTTVRDAWAQSSSSPWTISQFQTSSQEHRINVNYPTSLTIDQDRIEICLSGQNPGDYKGALIFREEEQGNSIVQFAIWLKVNVKETKQEQEEKPSSSKKSSEKSSSGGTSGILWTSQSTTQKTQSKENFQEISFNFPNEEIQLNKPSKSEAKMLGNQILLILLPIILMTILIFFLIRH